MRTREDAQILLFATIPFLRYNNLKHRGFCDLQFSNCAKEDLLRYVKDYITDRITVEKAGKSASVRICVTPVWFERRFEDHQQNVDEALAAMTELYQLSRTLVKETYSF